MVDQNIYNFNETGFQIGVISIIKIIIKLDQLSSCVRFIQPGNCKWMTVIKLINSTK